METTLNFSNGMNSDVSKQIHSKDSYLQALNFRGLTSLGSSNGSLVNIKGNDLNITLPELKDSYKIILGNQTSVSLTAQGSVTITINGSTTTVLNVSSTTTGFDIYTALKDLNNCYESTNSTPVTPVFNVSYEDDYAIIYQQPVYTLPLVNPATLTISITLSNPTVATHTLYFEDTTGVNRTTQAAYVTGSNNLTIIGSTFIDEDIYLFASDTNDTETNINPNDSFSNLGSIWKLQIDNVTKVSTLTLMYFNNLDFTRFYPIAPTAVLGRYESLNNQRLYWSDFYNSIRSVLITDPQLMAIKPALLSVFPAITFELPILNGFTSGSLISGSYELSYRLKKSTGITSNYSQTSNIVNLVNDESNTSGAGFIAYEGSSINTGRGIIWTIDNIDTSWDFIEFAILYRNTKTDLPVIYTTLPQNIGSTGSYTYTLSTITSLSEILLEEFISISSGFTHAKTVETKDNILFWGNVKAVKQKELNAAFDARAFRAKTSGDDDIYLINNGIAGTPITLAAAIATPKTNDNINPYYDSNGDVDPDACYYKPNTSVLGGAGKYVSYEFGTESILLSDIDVTEGSSGAFYIDAPTVGVPYGYRTAGTVSSVSNPIDLISGTTDSDNQVYPFPSTVVGTSKNPYFTSVMKGFQPEEIYRFGIQFFDLQGLPYFTEWIGDIKMPSYGDTNSNRDSIAITQSVPDFRASYLGPSNASIYGQVLYIKFTVDVTSVAEYISGYQIVRVERTDENKTILGHGMLTNMFVEKTLLTEACLPGGFYLDQQGFPSVANPIPPYLNQGRPWWPYPSYDALSTLGQDGTKNNIPTSSRILTFDCFDFLAKPYSFRTGDKVLIRSKVSPINWQNAKNGVGNPRFRTGFANQGQWINNSTTVGDFPNYIDPTTLSFFPRFRTGFDSEESMIHMLFYADTDVYNDDKVISKGVYVADGQVSTAADNGVIEFLNYQRSFGTVTNSETYVPGRGAATVLLTFDNSNAINSADIAYGATANTGEKLMALYYRPNINQYNGNTYSARTTNEYIACGSFIPLNRNNTILNNNKIITFKTFGGDVFSNYWDHQKVVKDATGVEIKMYEWQGGPNPPGNLTGATMSPMVRNNNIFYFPCNNTNNQAVRYGYHTDSGLTTNTLYYPVAIDDYQYQSYNSNEKTIVKFFPKPLTFKVNDEWRNRVHFSNVKIDNEIEDSWLQYPINQFYDVEGNYGGITSLIALKQNIYFIQEKGFGVLMINPVSMVNDSVGQPIKLGASNAVIQKHFYKIIDSGSRHQWSVTRSQNAISFIDIRQKKIYTFNGEQLIPISDIKGQRGFLNKRIHNNIINNDNPIIGKGLLSTYDYENNEFLYTIKNNTTVANTTNDENLTLAYSELQDVFTSMYSFNPNIYISNNRYLLSVDNIVNKQQIYLHNNGDYGKFYNVVYPSSLKLIINDNPLHTKVFDNATWNSESIIDNIQWSDDFNIYPGSSTNPNYPDDVNEQSDTFNKIRCYNDYQNTDWNTLTITKPNNNLTRKERNWNLQIPRNKFNYDVINPSIESLFNPTYLTKTTFGERLRDKYLIIDLEYSNSNKRFIINNIKIQFRISDR